MARAKPSRTPLTADEREGIVLAVNSAFRKLKNLYARIVPVFEDFGFTPPSAGVIARDLPEKIEEGDHSTPRVVHEGRRTLRSLPVRSRLRSEDLQFTRSPPVPLTR